MAKSSNIKTLLFLLVFWIGSACAVADENESVRVIAHAALSVDHLSLKELRSIYTMKRNVWPDGQAITVYVLENEVHKNFCMRILGVFPRQLESVWYRLVYSGTGSAPIKVESEEALLDRVRSTPGAIGYIERLQINDDVKVIEIDR